jgi:hypothetical protein
LMIRLGGCVSSKRAKARVVYVDPEKPLRCGPVLLGNDRVPAV